MLQAEGPSITVVEDVLTKISADIELPKPLQVACVLLVMEEISLDHFIDCFISEVEVDGSGKKLEFSMTQIKALLKEAFGYFDVHDSSELKANKFIFNFIIKLQTKLISLNIQQETAQNARTTIRMQ